MFPLVLKRNLDQWCLVPEFVKVVVFTQLGDKNMYDDITVVDDDPLPFFCPLDVEYFAVLLQSLFDGVGNGADLTV